MRFNWQQEDWPEFRFDLKAVDPALLRFGERAGRLTGLLDGLSEPQNEDTMLALMIAEAVQSSAIEGEQLDHNEVKSSIRNHLGLNQPEEPVRDEKAAGIGELMVSVRTSFAEPLTVEQLLGWHRMLMKGETRIAVGQWREGAEPMQIVSGPIGRPKVHFEAVPSHQVPEEMARFLRWFNEGSHARNYPPLTGAPLRSALAHLYFESIHPFEDGNGRLGRAISEKALSQGFGRPVPMSLSKTIEANRKDYYRCLQVAQTSNEVTGWVCFFAEMVLRAQEEAETLVHLAISKNRYFQKFESMLNARQLKVVRRLFEAEPKGFEGGMTARKYSAITGTSKATATRDLQHLLEIGALLQKGQGRSTRYGLP
jgi:Fic family protein